MRFVFTLAFLAAMAGQASATCVGSDAFQSCYDVQSGNNYTVHRSGNTTQVYGSNIRTGSHWSQQSTEFDGGSFNHGINKNGKPWNSTCLGAFCN